MGAVDGSLAVIINTSHRTGEGTTWRRPLDPLTPLVGKIRFNASNSFVVRDERYSLGGEPHFVHLSPGCVRVVSRGRDVEPSDGVPLPDPV